MARKDNYEQLRKKWYAKLKCSGFEDAETMIGELKRYSSTLIANKNKVLFQNGGWKAKEEYYRLASQFLNDHTFKAKLDQVIWEYHTNGISFKNIAMLLNKTRTKQTNRTSIWAIVRQLRAEMFNKYGVR
jgi:hypothetical protein